MLVDLRPGLRNYLASVPAIAAMVSDRIFPIRMREGERNDSIVYFQVVETESYHMRGPSNLVGARMQIDSWSQSADRSKQLGDLVKEALGGYSGTMFYGGSSPSDFVVVQGIFMLTGHEDYDQEVQLYRLSRDYNIVYEASL